MEFSIERTSFDSKGQIYEFFLICDFMEFSRFEWDLIPSYSALIRLNLKFQIRMNPNLIFTSDWVELKWIENLVVVNRIESDGLSQNGSNCAKKDFFSETNSKKF